MEKQCFSCKLTKPIADFYKHPMMADGHLGKCKECTKRDVKARRYNPKFREKVLAYDRARGSRQDKEYLVEYRKRFPNKDKAQRMVGNAIRNGKLFREPCSICGEKGEAHHDDYAKPLNVRWLCSAHHKQWHAENGEGKNGR